MTPDEALAFLASHQPMPPDDDITQEDIDAFDAAWRVLRDHPDDRVPRLLVNAFGDGDGFGVYQLAGDALQTQRREVVVEALRDALRSEHRGVRSWASELAMEYPDPALDGPVCMMLEQTTEDDVRYFATAYVADRGLTISAEVIDRLRQGADPDLLDLLQEIEGQIA